MRYLASVAAVAALAVFAAPASASTARLVDVELQPECKPPPPSGVCPPFFAPVLLYEAAPGEANVVSVEGARVTDPGAVIEPGRGCTPVDQHRVECEAHQRVFIDAGDRADTVRSGGVVNGGPGNDLLVGGPLGDVLYGGGGRDVLRGGVASDRLHDASPRDPFGSSDLSGFLSDVPSSEPSLIPLATQGRGRDVFDGGPDHDLISYEGRVADVRLDLARTAAVAGARREHDSLRDFESAISGAGDDRLSGNRRANDLDGGAGADRIFGRRGDDQIEDGMGRNVTVGGKGDDTVTSPGRVFCGSGLDSVNRVMPSHFVNDDCEELVFDFLRNGGVFGGPVVSFLPLDEDEPPIVFSTGRLWCFFEANPSGCGLTVRVRVDRGGALLGSRSYTFAPDERKSVTLELSRAGSRFLRRHGALLVRVQIIEDQAPQRGGYLTILRAP